MLTMRAARTGNYTARDPPQCYVQWLRVVECINKFLESK